MSSRGLDVQRDIAKETGVLVTALLLRISWAGYIAVAYGLLVRRDVVRAPAVLALYNCECIVCDTGIVASTVGLV